MLSTSLSSPSLGSAWAGHPNWCKAAQPTTVSAQRKGLVGVRAERDDACRAGLIAKIPYLQQLGVTAVELLPVQQFDEQDAVAPPHQLLGVQSRCVFCPPHRGYCASAAPDGPVAEFRALVKALHRAGIEVILDVVVNHTAEGDHAGPTLCFRGLENRAYYILQAERARYS